MLTGNPGGYNMLNVPDKEFFSRTDEPFLEAAAQRGDEIYLATKPNFYKAKNGGNIYKIDEKLTGFGREFECLTKKDYKYDALTGKMVKK